MFRIQARRNWGCHPKIIKLLTGAVVWGNINGLSNDRYSRSCKPLIILVQNVRIITIHRMARGRIIKNKSRFTSGDGLFKLRQPQDNMQMKCSFIKEFILKLSSKKAWDKDNISKLNRHAISRNKDDLKTAEGTDILYGPKTNDLES